LLARRAGKAVGKAGKLWVIIYLGGVIGFEAVVVEHISLPVMLGGASRKQD